jgi:hypothetical protein
MKILSRAKIPKPADDQYFRSNTFPCIIKLPSGRWIAGFKAAEIKGDCDFQHAVMTWSDDEGQTWVPPFEPIKLPAIDGITGMSRILYFLSLGGKRVLMLSNWVDSSDLSKPYYNPENESLKDTRIFFSFSEDEGESWSPPALMKIPGVGDPVPLTGPPLLLADGTIVCQFEINKHDWDTTPWIHKSAMVFSYDQGRTWTDVVNITAVENMYYWDQRPQVMADGKTILNFFWTLDGEKQEYINIHTNVSRDGGKTWSELRDTGVYGQPGQPVDLGDQRIATISVDRTVSPVITIRTSTDFGLTYDEPLIVFEKQNLGKQDSRQIGVNDAWDEMMGFSVGHPGLIKLNDTEILAYYYAGDHTDETSIEFVRIQL